MTEENRDTYVRCPRIMLAAPNGEADIQMVSEGIIQALKQRGYQVFVSDCGRQGNHEAALGKMDCQNLAQHLVHHELTLLKGICGYYDGREKVSVEDSPYDVALQLQIPVVLVIDSEEAGLSVLPVLKGFVEFYRKSMIQGVIFKGMSADVYPEVRKLAERLLPVSVLGYVPPWKTETEQTEETAKLMEETIEIDMFLKLAWEAPRLEINT